MSTYVSRVIGKRSVGFPLIAEGQQIGKRGENKLVAESFNVLGQLVLSIKDRYWRKTGVEAFSPYMRNGVETVKV